MMCNGANLRITPRLPKRKNKCVEITPTFIDVIQLCMFSERERASVVCWVVDVLGLCKLVCYVCFGVYVYLCICIYAIHINMRVATCDVEVSPI